MSAVAGTVEQMFNHPLRLLASFLPLLLGLLLVFLINMPVSFTGGLLPAPALALACVYFWVLVRPDLMPPAAVLLIGLAEDLLSGGPPGLWAAGFLAAYWLTDRERDSFAGLTGVGALVGFAAVVLSAALAAYGLETVVYLRLAPVAPLLLHGVSTVVFYPLVALPMGWLLHKVVGPMRGGE